ncbi:MAG TPA: PPOX class F420-dependent oxidoreductase [Pseudonocardiaceae bacterium]|jgi:pyridoxamine 5'-phosphate oxidase family protein
MTLTSEERDYLASQPLGRLATRRPDGSLQNNPVGFRYNEETGTIDIGGLALGATRKFHNVAANGVVALVVDDLVSRNPWTVRGVEIRGDAEALVDQQPMSGHTSPEIIRIHPRRVISWGIGTEPGMHGRDVDSAHEQPAPPR